MQNTIKSRCSEKLFMLLLLLLLSQYDYVCKQASCYNHKIKVIGAFLFFCAGEYLTIKFYNKVWVLKFLL